MPKMKYSGKKTFLFVTFLLFFILQISVLSAQTIRVIVRGVPERTGYLDGIYSGGDYYVSTEELAEILNINTYHDEQLEKIVLYLDGTQITVSSANPFIKIGGELFQMPIEAKDYSSTIYVPVGEFAPILNRHLSGSYLFKSDERSLEIYPGGDVNITDLTVEEKENGTLVRVKTSTDFTDNMHHWFDKEKSHLTVQFYKGRLDTLQMTSDETRGLVLQNTAIQFPEIAQITFKLSRYTEGYYVDQDESDGDILISLMKKGAAPTEPPTADPSIFRTEDLVARDKESWKLDTIVIDPGHGGKDPGTVSSDGLLEKDIVLDIGKHLKQLLVQSGLFKNVIMTREQDVFVPLMDRAEIAKDMSGKIFVSIHVNSNKNSRIRGFEAYFLRPGKNDDALEVLEVVQRENDVMQLYEDADPSRELSEEEQMVLAMTQSAFVKESDMLARYISDGIGRKVRWPNRGVKQAGFLVLWGVPMPNVLVEVGFISNSSQRKELRTRAVRYRVAEGIFEGIKKFTDEMRR